jgi:hypothetical protein
MKTLLENWKKTISEVEEQPPADKREMFGSLEKEAIELINKVNVAAKGDANLYREAIESLIVILQDNIKGG